MNDELRDELKELIDNWRDPEDRMYGSEEAEKAAEMCADELRAVLEEHQ